MKQLSIPGLLLAALLATGLAGCDSAGVEAAEGKQPGDAMREFLQTPQRANVGAHRQNDPHAALDADKLGQVALQHLDEGRAQLALDTLNSALDRHPDSAMLLNLRSSLLLQQGQTSLALADLNRALELEPHDATLLTNRAQALRQFGRADDARRDLDRVIEIDPGFFAAYFNRGSLHFEAENYGLALSDFNRCIELEPGVPAAYFNRASTHEALGERASAISDLQHFLSLSPEPGWAQTAEGILNQWQSGNS